MTFIIESLFAVFKDFHWLVSDTLLIFFVNYLMFHALGSRFLGATFLLGGLCPVVLAPLLPYGIQILLNPLIILF